MKRTDPPTSFGEPHGGQDPAGRPGIVFHADADAFFASCHRAEDPSLHGIPMVVAGDPGARRGVVLAASYEARPYGVRSAMPLAQALRLCPSLRVIPPDRTLYERYSVRLHSIFSDFTPEVEAFSIDEAWLNVTGALEAFANDPIRAADRLRERVRAELGVTVSVGVSTNRHLAKQASSLRKPDSTNVLFPEDVPALLWPLPLTDLFGCGERTAQALSRLRIVTIGDLARCAPERLASVLGLSHAALLRARALGHDEEPVHAGGHGPARSLSAEHTLPGDVETREEAEPILLALADEVARHLRAEGYQGRTVVLKYKTARFALHTSRITLPQPTALRDDLYDVACRLFVDRKVQGPVRLLGLGCTSLMRGGVQLTLDDRARRLRLAQAEDALRKKYGQSAVLPARLLPPPTSPPQESRGNGPGPGRPDGHGRPNRRPHGV